MSSVKSLAIQGSQRAGGMNGCSHLTTWTGIITQIHICWCRLKMFLYNIIDKQLSLPQFLFPFFLWLKIECMCYKMVEVNGAYKVADMKECSWKLWEWYPTSNFCHARQLTNRLYNQPARYDGLHRSVSYSYGQIGNKTKQKQKQTKNPLKFWQLSYWFLKLHHIRTGQHKCYQQFSYIF